MPGKSVQRVGKHFAPADSFENGAPAARLSRKRGRLFVSDPVRRIELLFGGAWFAVACVLSDEENSSVRTGRSRSGTFPAKGAPVCLRFRPAALNSHSAARGFPETFNFSSAEQGAHSAVTFTRTRVQLDEEITSVRAGRSRSGLSRQRTRRFISDFFRRTERPPAGA